MSTWDQIPADVAAKALLDKFGREPQTLKAIEELNECAARLAKDLGSHHSPNPKHGSPYDMTVEEIADATLMLRQMRLVYGWQAVDRAIELKVERTFRRLETGL